MLLDLLATSRIADMHPSLLIIENLSTKSIAASNGQQMAHSFNVSTVGVAKLISGNVMCFHSEE